MKISSILVALLTSLVIFFCISLSRKTTGKIKILPEVTLPKIEKEKKVIVQKELRLISDLSDPQLLALDPETTEIIRLATLEKPEETAEWAERLSKDQNPLKVLQLVLHYWADQNPRTCWNWTENGPFKKLSLYLTVAKSWASNSPIVCAEWVYEKIAVKQFRLPIMKSIIQIWAEEDPAEAAEWLNKKNILFNTATIIDTSKNVEELYSPLIHTWFKKYPGGVFTWLLKQNKDQALDLDALFHINKWAEENSTELLQWLKDAPGGTYTDQLKAVGIHAIARHAPQLITDSLESPDSESIKDYLIEASITQSAATDTPAALKALSLLTNYKLRQQVCLKVAMELVGKNDLAIEFVKVAGISSFPALNSFFQQWGELKGKDALDWLKDKTIISLVAPDIYSQTRLEWNADNPSTLIETAHQENLDFLAKSSNTNGLLPATEFPIKFLEKYKIKIAQWPRLRNQLATLVIQSWAKVDYLNCQTYVNMLENRSFKMLCFKALFGQTPETEFANSLKIIDSYENNITKKELYSALAIAMAAHSPNKAISLLKKNNINEIDIILKMIDASIKTKDQELLTALKKLRGEYTHIYIPYYFYKLTEHKPTSTKATLDKYSRRLNVAGLKAIAAGYLDFHQKKSKKWYLSLKANERQIVEEILKIPTDD
jgi:hypothetical protein